MTNTASSVAVPLGGAKAWSIWFLSALAFGYAFFQRVAPSVMVSDLMREFSVGAAVLGQLSALYFYPYALMQIPIGLLLDRFGARLLLSLAMVAAALGTIAFAIAPSLEWAFAGRILIGAGSAVGFIGSLALASRWFPARRFALIVGLTMLLAMVCGVAGQAPLAALVGAFGWRPTMLASGLAAGAIAVAIALAVRNSPEDVGTRQPRRSRGWTDLRVGLGRVVRSAEVWGIAVVGTSLAGPMLAFGGLWGVPYVMTAYGLPRPEAALLVSMTLVGWAIGAPAAGWLSDHVRRRKAPLVVGATALSLLTGLLATPGLPLWVLVVVMFGIGAAGGHMTISFALAREVTPASVHGSVTGLVNGMTVASAALLQPLIGAMLDASWQGEMAGGVRVYAESDYRFAFLSLVIWSLMGFAASLFLRETRCRPVEQPSVTA